MLKSNTAVRLEQDETESLLSTPYGADFTALLERAASTRDEGLRASGREGIVTYSRKVFLPLTTLCRDRCHYCVFVDTPLQLAKKRAALYMTPERVLAVARQGAALGCKEALLTLGDRPEDRWPEARQWLEQHGYASTIDYVAAMAEMITRETGMLAHANPGVMTFDELRRLRGVSPSMGMMLETTSRRLFEEPGQVHFGSPDKDPALRLGVIEDAGRLGIPFTTGILVGIGETIGDRAESLLALRELQETYGHLQEIIIQNFRAKPKTAMQSTPDAATVEYLATIAVARLVFGPHLRIQVPPNLTDPDEVRRLLGAGADDWGGVSPLTADHVNPERPWPHLDDLRELSAGEGFTLRERLTAQPEYIREPTTWIDPSLREAVTALADPGTGLARVREDGGILPPTPSVAADARPGSPRSGRADLSRLVDRAAADPEGLDDAEWARMLLATGAELDALCTAADEARRFTVGEAISFTPNRNLTSSGLRERRDRDESPPTTFTLDDVRPIVADSWDLGASELCVQGLLPTTADPSGYLDIVRAAKAAQPRMHLHAYRPADIVDFSDRRGIDVGRALELLREAGVDSLPGTGVKILDESVRRDVAPDDLDVDRWVEVIRTAHRMDFRTSSVIFYGHVETAAQRVAHLRTLRTMQDDALASGHLGFTEIVPVPLPGGGGRLDDSRAPVDEHRAMFAVTRLLLSGSIPQIQVPWTRLGLSLSATLLGAGANDLGGTLFDGRVLPQTGVEFGTVLPPAAAARLAHSLFRPLRQRTSDYREPAADRKVAWE